MWKAFFICHRVEIRPGGGGVEWYFSISALSYRVVNPGVDSAFRIMV